MRASAPSLSSDEHAGHRGLDGAAKRRQKVASQPTPGAECSLQYCDEWLGRTRLFNNVYERWKLVLDLIKKDDGGDKFVESNRGKLFRAPSREAEDLDEDVAQRGIDDEGLTANDVDEMDLGLD